MNSLRKLNVKTFESNMTDAAEKLAKIPAAIIAGLSPLMKSNKSKGLLASVLGGRIMSTFGMGSGESVTTSFTKSDSQDVINALKDINSFIGPVSSQLQLTVNAFKKFQSAVKGIPSISKKYTDALRLRMQNMMSGLGRLIGGIKEGINNMFGFGGTDKGTMTYLEGISSSANDMMKKIIHSIAPMINTFKMLSDVVAEFKSSANSKAMRSGAKGLPQIEANIRSLTNSMAGIFKSAKILSDPELHMSYVSDDTAKAYGEAATSGIRVVGAFIHAAFSKGEGGAGRTMKKLADKSTPATLMAVNRSVINSGHVLKSLGSTLDSAKKLTAPSLDRFENIGVAINNAITDIANAGQIMETESFEKVKPVVDALARFGGGNVTLTHNMPNTKIQLTVRLNSRRFAKQLVKTPLKMKAGADNYIQHATTKPSIK